jgi:hypothetical protein
MDGVTTPFPAAATSCADGRIPRLDELGMPENRAGNHIQPHRKEKRSQASSGDFVQFECIQIRASVLTRIDTATREDETGHLSRHDFMVRLSGQ